MPEEEFTFILSSIEFVATYGHRFLSLYSFDWVTGNWTFRKRACKYHLLKESHDLKTMQGLHMESRRKEKNVMLKVFDNYLEWAMKIAMSLHESSESCGVPEDIDPSLILFRV
jgi:hypothetical protein